MVVQAAGGYAYSGPKYLFKRVTATPADAPQVALLARLPANAPVREGTTISLAIDPDQVIILRD